MRLINSTYFGDMNESEDGNMFGAIEDILKNEEIVHWLGSSANRYKMDSRTHR